MQCSLHLKRVDGFEFYNDNMICFDDIQDFCRFCENAYIAGVREKKDFTLFETKTDNEEIFYCGANSGIHVWQDSKGKEIRRYPRRFKITEVRGVK